jgi:hypothetical protein
MLKHTVSLTCDVLQSRLRGVAMGFFVLCLILFVYVAYGNCKAYLQVKLAETVHCVLHSGMRCIYTFAA